VHAGLVIERAVRRHARRVAVEMEGRSLTFGELGDRVFRLGRGLRALGLEHGDRVLDLQSNGVTYVETDLAMAVAGLVRVTLNYRLAPADWVRIAEDCGARGLVYEARFAAAAGPLLDLVEHAVVIGDGAGARYEDVIAGSPPTALELHLAPDDLVSLNYSSGTTGSPKGSRRTHRNRLASLQNIVTDIYGGLPADDDAWVHAGPITHASGLFVLPHLAFGARQVILPSWDPDGLLHAVVERGGTGTVLVPTMIARLLAGGVPPGALAPLRRLVYAGAPMPPEQVRAAHAELTPNLVQMYGLVEAIPPVTVLDAADHDAGVRGRPEVLASAGRACFGVELRIVDDEGADVPGGEVGEVLTRGDHVMSGYWADADATAAKAVRDGWLHTGDLGRVDEEGRLFLVDRKGDMIISGGYNIYPREVEDVIAEVAGVAEVAVVGVADAEWGQRVTAFYRAQERSGVADADVLEHCGRRLASYKKPKGLIRVSEFPLNSTGKIDKRRLRRELEEDAPA
jgi:acyl-CoA synthetase (AMP-forming)/AMP-acid ligase II